MLEQRLTWQEIETSTDIEHLKQVLRIYSKAANTRLRALEKAGLAGNSNAYQTVRNYAYDVWHGLTPENSSLILIQGVWK